MPVEQAVAFYRVGLVDAIILLLFFILAFATLTVGCRPVWAALGARESLLARIAAAALLASISVGGASGIVDNLLQPTFYANVTISADTAKNQAILGIGLALAITIVSVIRIELYNRARVSAPLIDEDADWKVEPPEAAGRR